MAHELVMGILLINIVCKSTGQYNVSLQAPKAAVVGYPFQLTCTVEPNVLGVEWFYRRRGSGRVTVGQLATNGCTAYHVLPRYNYTCGTQTSQRGVYKLTILNVTKSDRQVVWTCGTINTNAQFSSNNFTLLTAFLAEIYEIPDTIGGEFGSLHSLQRHTTERQRISLRCSASGFPAPTVTWMTRGTILISKFHYVSYNFTAQWTNHQQNFFCIASNIDYVTPQNISVQLIVSFSPKLLSVIPNQTAKEGQKYIQFNCPRIKANPSIGLTYNWTKSRVQVGTGQTLIINDVSRSHSGEYACRISNSVGTSDPSYMLFDVLFRPKFLYALPNIFAIEGQKTIQFTCPKAEANPSTGLTYIWTRFGVRVGTEQILVINNVSRSHAGRYTCRIRNSVGTSDPSHMYFNVLFSETVVSRDSTALKAGSIVLVLAGTLLCIVGISFFTILVFRRRNKNPRNGKGEDNLGHAGNLYDDLNTSQANITGNTYEEIQVGEAVAGSS